MNLYGLEPNFLIASASLFVAAFVIALVFWLHSRWRFLSGQSEKAKEVAACAKTWSLVGAIFAVLVLLVLAVLLVFLNPGVFSPCEYCTR